MIKVSPKFKVSVRIERAAELVDALSSEKREPVDKYIQLECLRQLIEQQQAKLRGNVLALLDQKKSESGWVHDNFGIKVNGVVVNLRYESDHYKYTHNPKMHQVAKFMNKGRVEMRKNRREGMPEDVSAIPIPEKASLLIHLSGHIVNKPEPDHNLK